MAGPPNDADRRPLWQRLAWMGGIWLASVIGLGLLALVLRIWLKV